MASYNIQSSLRPKARPTKEQDDKPAVGIGSRDKPEEKEEKSFFDTVSDWFTGAGANLTPEEQARENGATLYTLPEFDEATRRSAEESALYRMDMGITSSLVEGGDEAFREKLPDGTTYSPPKRPGLTFEEAEDALVTIPEPEPVTVEDIGKAYYNVVGGDTLDKIAKKNNTTVKALLEANPDMDNPNLISVGQEIKLPGATPTGAGLMSPTTSLSKKTSPTAAVEDVVITDGPIIADQLRQDVSDGMEPSKTLPKIEAVGDEVPFNQSTSSGSVQGVEKTYKLGDEERTIIDTSSTAKSDPSLKYPSKPEKINVQNVVMHYTAAEYRNGVRHYMNSFNLRGPSAAYLVTRDGQIYQTFDPTVKGSHVAGSKTKNPRGLITNSNSVGIEVEATDDSPPTKAQLDASAWLSDYIMEKYDAKRVVAHPQANVHKGHVEGYDLVNHWRKRNNLPELEVSKDAIERLFTLSQELETSPRPKARPES